MQTEQQVIDTSVKSGKPFTAAEIVAQKYRDFVFSPIFTEMQTAEQYYLNFSDIGRKQRYSVGENGQLVPVNNLSNKKLHHNFFKELVDQKIDYLLARPWTISTKDTKYNDIVNKVFDDDFRNKFSRTVKNAVIKRNGFMFPYIKDNELKFKYLDALNTIAVYEDDQEDEIDSFIRFYNQEVFDGRTKRIKTFAELWTVVESVRTFEINEFGGATEIGQAEAMYLKPDENGNMQGYNWDRIPLIEIAYNDEKVGLLRQVKSLQDEYDAATSGNADKLADEGNSILILKNAMATALSNFRRNINIFRMVKLNENSELEKLDDTAKIDNTKDHIELLRRDIYTFGRGVDVSNANVGANASAEARQYIFAGLDMDCNSLERSCRSALRKILWFVEQYYGLKRPDDLEITFNRDIAVNEMQAVEIAVKMLSIPGVSTLTVLEQLPMVKNAGEEYKRWEQEQTQRQQSNIFNTGDEE